MGVVIKKKSLAQPTEAEYAAHDAEWRRTAPPVPPNLADPINARVFFFWVIQDRGRHVLVQLRDSVRPRGAWLPLAELPAAIESWARRFDLTHVGEDGARRVPAWVTKQAHHTVAIWHDISASIQIGSRTISCRGRIA